MTKNKSTDKQDIDGAPLVSVVVPAYNAEKTIEETLRSICAQTYRNLEILIVDDGSTDSTAQIVTRYARADPRVRLIGQANAGVAAARNRGVAEAKSEFIAPVDADDLWRPTKIAKQMAIMLGRGDKVGLVYTWQAIINDRGRVVSFGRRSHEEGWVFSKLLARNFIGSGSPTLMRKQAVLEAGGYDCSLLAQSAQGCEDLKLYLKISQHYEFAVVKEFLTGYRRSQGNMSSDCLQMLRSCDLVFAEFRRTHPQHVRSIEAGRAYIRRWLLGNAVRAKAYRSIAVLAIEVLKVDPLFLLKFLAVRLALRPIRRGRRALERILLRDEDMGPPIRFLAPPDSYDLDPPEVRR